MALVGYFAIVCSNKFLTTNFIYLKIIQFVLLIFLFFFMFINLINFQGLKGFGASSYLEDNWPRVLKDIDMREFDSGLLACEGGKYLQDTQISPIFEEVECPVWKGYDNMTKRDGVALLWELKGTGISDSDESVYGCLNPECASSLKSGLASNQLIMMFVILGLAFLNMFSIGLASHTLKFDIHYRQILQNVFIIFTLVGIIGGGVLLVVLTNYAALTVSPDSLWNTGQQFALPPLAYATNYNEDEWYKLLGGF